MTVPFRPEVLDSRGDRLAGEITIFVPVRWQLIGYLIFGGLCACLVFLTLATYARVETAPGLIVPDKGVVAIVPTRAGIITTVAVGNGQHVARGEALAIVQAEQFMVEGGSSASAIEAAMARQDNSLSAQARSAYRASAAQQRENQAVRAGLAGEIVQLQTQVDLQRRLVASTRADVDRMRAVAGRGFISARDMQLREDGLISREQQLAQLNQLLGSRRAALSEAERAAERIAAELEAGAAGLDASRAQVEQQAVGVRGDRAYVLRAPMAGRVTALDARPGQPASPQHALMTIVPDGAVLRVELGVSTSAIAFLQPGQETRIAVDAFPYQRFGTLRGRVADIPGSTVERIGPDGQIRRVYPVIVVLEENQMTASGRPWPLLPGMTLSARIVTERQSFIRWLFAPLFAVQSR